MSASVTKDSTRLSHNSKSSRSKPTKTWTVWWVELSQLESGISRIFINSNNYFLLNHWWWGCKVIKSSINCKTCGLNQKWTKSNSSFLKSFSSFSFGLFETPQTVRIKAWIYCEHTIGNRSVAFLILWCRGHLFLVTLWTSERNQNFRKVSDINSDQVVRINVHGTFQRLKKGFSTEICSVSRELFFHIKKLITACSVYLDYDRKGVLHTST